MLYIFSSLFYSYRILLKSGIQVALWDPVSMRRNSKSHAMANAIHVITWAIQTPHFRFVTTLIIYTFDITSWNHDFFSMTWEVVTAYPMKNHLGFKESDIVENE